jgi:hypothetical protein
MGMSKSTKLNDFVDLNAPIVGMPDRVIPMVTRVEVGRSCANCLHWDPEKGKKHWEFRRQGTLAVALEHEHKAKTALLAGKRDLAEAHEKKAKGVGMMVDSIDQAVMAGKFGLCAKGWAPPDCKDDVPLIDHTTLCHKWSGRDGSSLATAGFPLDKLPDELRDELMPKPDPVRLAKAKAEAEEKARFEAQRIHLPVIGGDQ